MTVGTNLHPNTHRTFHTAAPDVVAHRGASQDVPEHTLAAYAKAIEDGADALECDVRLTADGVLVCVHDRRVDRASNGRGLVSTLELADLVELDFGSWKAGWNGVPEPEEPDRDHCSVLTLARLLELVADCERQVEMAIETKHPTRYAELVERRRSRLGDRHCGRAVDVPGAARAGGVRWARGASPRTARGWCRPRAGPARPWQARPPPRRPYGAVR
jgi:glycerophosphoryl diester phosphodiesterase